MTRATLSVDKLAIRTCYEIMEQPAWRDIRCVRLIVNLRLGRKP